MSTKGANSGEGWLPLGEASRLIGVKQATLRLWADRGLVHIIRTAGGHRRFDREHLLRLVKVQEEPRGQADLAERTVQGLRRHIRRRRPTRSLFQRVNEESLGRFRVLGRRLVEVATRYHSEPRRHPSLLEEARVIGLDYAAQGMRLGLELRQAAEAFLSHRSLLLETVRSLTPADSSKDWVFGLLRDLTTLTDTVLLALVEGYQRMQETSKATSNATGAKSWSKAV